MSWSSWKVKIRVSHEIVFLEVKMAFFQVRGSRKVGAVDLVVSSPPDMVSPARAARPVESRVPMW